MRLLLIELGALIALLVLIVIEARHERPIETTPAWWPPPVRDTIFGDIWQALHAYKNVTAESPSALHVHPATMHRIQRNIPPPQAMTWQQGDGVFGINVVVDPLVPEDQIIVIPSSSYRYVAEPPDLDDLLREVDDDWFGAPYISRLINIDRIGMPISDEPKGWMINGLS
jgi:hypothetical protein